MTGSAAVLTLRCQFCETWNHVNATRASERPKCGKCAKPILLDRPWVLQEDSFARTIADTRIPVLVDFYATWCGPCKIMAPAVDQLSAKYVGRALVAKLDTDRAPTTARSFDIRGVPTVVVFTAGKEIARQSGALPFAALEALLLEACAPPA